MARPYASPEDLVKVLDRTKQVRIQRALQQHKAWLSFDLMFSSDPAEEDKQLFYRSACSLAAQSLQGECVAFWFLKPAHSGPRTQRPKRLCLPEDPRLALKEWEPVSLVNSDDSRMNKAIKDAKRRRPESEDAFRKRSSDLAFAVKAPFCDKDFADGEWMWVMVTEISGVQVEGGLLNDPVHGSAVHKDEVVRSSKGAVGDWVYNHGKKVHGGFTQAVRRRQKA